MIGAAKRTYMLSLHSGYYLGIKIATNTAQFDVKNYRNEAEGETKSRKQDTEI